MDYKDEKENKPKTRAKRKLTNIDFTGQDAAVALVSKKQGGPANSQVTLLLKNSNNEIIQKMQQVKVTMELPDFLQRFFYMMEDDAEVLATMMGYREVAETQAMEDEEAQSDVQEWIKERMASFEIMKSLKESKNIKDTVAKLNQEDYLGLLQDQEKVEKAFSLIDSKLSKAAKVGDMVSWNSSGGRATGKVERIVRDGSINVPGSSFSISGTPDNPAALIRLYRDGKPTDTRVGHKVGTLSKVSKSTAKESTVDALEAPAVDASIMQHEDSKGVNPVVKQKEIKESPMDKEITVTEQEITVEMVEKSAFESLQKSLQDQQVQLQKALDEIKVYQEEKQAAIVKSKTAAIAAVVPQAELQAPILKAALAVVEQADFDAFVQAITKMAQQVETSELFKEAGSAAEPEVEIKVNPVANLLKSKYAAK